MPRPTKKDEAIKGDIETLRKQAIKQFFGLTPKIYAHIESSMVATRPCQACFVEADGTSKPGKAKDADGKCAMCHGTFLVPDYGQRNWATEQAQPIVAPAPKTVEMSVENTSSIPELEEKAASLTDEQLQQKLEVLNLDVASNGRGN